MVMRNKTKAIVWITLAVTCLLYLQIIKHDKEYIKKQNKNAKRQIRKIQHLKDGGNLLPDAVIIGASKCGTTALHFFMEAHPDVLAVTNQKTFFQRYDRKVPGFPANITEISAAQISAGKSFILEKSPDYWKASIRNPEIIQENVQSTYLKYGKPSKLILTVCDPYLRCLSTYSSYLSHNSKAHMFPTFESFMTNISTGEITNGHPMDSSLYDQVFPFWQRFFDRNQLIIVDGDMFKSDPYTEVKKLERSLGLRDYMTRDMFRYNVTKGFFCRVENGKDICLPHNKGREHPLVPANFTQRVKNHLLLHNKNFSNMVQQTFSWSV